MESRGPSRYKNPFDLALLESQLGFIVRFSYPHPSLRLLTSVQFSLAVKSHQPCFISSPEWQVLFPPEPVFPYHTSQPRSLTLRTQRWNVLAALPQLFIEFSEVTATQNPVDGSAYTANYDLLSSFTQVSSNDTEKLDYLVSKTQKLFQAIKTWVENESDILRPNSYPDVIAAVLDCNASMALITLTKMLGTLQQIGSRSSSPESDGSSSTSTLYQTPWMDDPAVIEYWRHRGIAAYEHVRKESMVASKVLEFGMEQMRMLDDRSGQTAGACQFPYHTTGRSTPLQV